MTKKRYTEIMTELGNPNSKSLLAALQQVAVEVERETREEVLDGIDKVIANFKKYKIPVPANATEATKLMTAAIDQYSIEIATALGKKVDTMRVF